MCQFKTKSTVHANAISRLRDDARALARFAKPQTVQSQFRDLDVCPIPGLSVLVGSSVR